MAGIFKAYDVRGTYPDQLDETTAEQIGRAFRVVLEGTDDGGTVVVSRDMRSHSEPLAEALIEGLLASGLDVIDIGLATTPMNYFAVGHLGANGGIAVTASHNPARYNGFKFSRREARPVSGTHGIPTIEEAVRSGKLPGVEPPRRAPERDHLRRLPRARALVPEPPGGRPPPQGGGRLRQRHGLDLPADPGGDRHRADPALFRARRHLPQPRGQPAQVREPGGPLPRGPRAGLRPGGRLRRRRRPGRLRRRAGRAGREATWPRR